MKKNKNIIGAAVIILAVLALVFLWGGNSPGLYGWNTSNDIPSVAPADTINTSDNPEATPSHTPSETPVNEVSEIISQSVPNDKGNPYAEQEKPYSAQAKSAPQSDTSQTDADYSRQKGMEINEETGKDQYLTAPVPDGKPVPEEPEDSKISDTALTCTLSVRCDTVLQNLSFLNPEKTELIPENGVIYPETAVTFYEGESVFNVLLREMKKNKIHMEYTNTPIYNSAYIEGINNLYEFDCGELSGWMYKVNDWFPNYGCSRYRLNQGDRIEVLYTCSLGADIGGSYSSGEQK